MVQLLLLTSSHVPGRGFLDHALPAVTELMAGRERMLFVPYARRDFDTYARSAHSVLSAVGIKLDGLHRAADPVAAIRAAEVVFLGGGNTFRLLATLQRQDLMRELRRAALSGVPFLGAGAGATLACPSLRTSNDMAVLQPASFAALNLLPQELRDIVVLLYYDRKPMTEIADLMHLSYGAVKLRHQNALMMLREELKYLRED